MKIKASISILFLVLFGCEPQINLNTTSVELMNQNLTEIPDSIFSMANLKVLYMGNSFAMYPPMAITGPNMNKIKQLPDKIGQLQNLKVLNLTAVDLRSLSKGIIELNQLDTLVVSFNTQLNISNELATLDKMLWLKYLNIVGTNANRTTIEHLRKSLPNTKIATEFEEISKRFSE